MIPKGGSLDALMPAMILVTFMVPAIQAQQWSLQKEIQAIEKRLDDLTTQIAVSEKRVASFEELEKEKNKLHEEVGRPSLTVQQRKDTEGRLAEIQKELKAKEETYMMARMAIVKLEEERKILQERLNELRLGSGQDLHRRAIHDLTSLATAVESYAVDFDKYPDASNLTELQEIIVPTYMSSKRMPLKDPWGEPYLYRVDGALQNYWIISYGADRKPETDIYDSQGKPKETANGATSSPEADLIFSVGELIRYPEGLMNQAYFKPAIQQIYFLFLLLSQSSWLNVASAQSSLTEEAAMDLLFSNYDAKKGESVWNASSSEEELPIVVGAVDSVYSRPIFFGTLNDGSRSLLIYRTTSPDNYCGPCADAVGGAVFTRVQNQWRVQVNQVTITVVSAVGGGVFIEIARIGPNQEGLIFHIQSRAFGHLEGMVELYQIGERQFYQIGSVEDTEANNDGVCGEDLEQCWQYESKLEFRKGSHPEYFEMIVTTQGTGPDGTLGSGQERKFIFVGSGYREAKIGATKK